MEEDFDIEDKDRTDEAGKRIDDLFRNALAGYTEEPGNDMWIRLDHKLNRKEIAYFFSFRKNYHGDASENKVLPLYRQQWFRGVIAACIILLIAFVTISIAVRVNTGDHFSKNLASNNIDLKLRMAQGAGNDGTYHDWQQILNNTHTGSRGNNEYIALQNDRYNSFTNMPYKAEPTDQLSPVNNVSLYADNSRQYKQNLNNGTHSPDMENSADHAVERNFVPFNNDFNNNQPVIADNGMNNNNNPLTDINVRNGQNNNNQVDRNNSARKADSVIKANTIKDNTERQPINNDRNNNIHNEDTDVNSVIDDRVFEKPVVPNIFSPNGDGSNDYFVIKNLDNYPDNHLVVVGRNGKTIYEKKEYHSNWNAENVPDGTYFYILTYKNEKKETLIIRGTVYIIR